jgi:DNA-binding response OmpR family regulator
MSEVASRVLVIDDEAVYRRILRLGLSERGFEVDVAGDADTAMRIAGSFQPNVVVVDQVLRSRMHGSELAVAIRARLPACGIVAMSGCVETGDIWPVRTRWLSKPFELGQLESVIRLVLEHVESGDEGGGAEIEKP